MTLGGGHPVRNYLKTPVAVVSRFNRDPPRAVYHGRDGLGAGFEIVTKGCLRVRFGRTGFHRTNRVDATQSATPEAGSGAAAAHAKLGVDGLLPYGCCWG